MSSQTALQSAPKARGRPTADASSENMARLVNVAFRHFVEFGPKQASIQAIAEEVGLTRQTIYLRFGTKENFFSTIIQSRDIAFFEQHPIDFETDERPVQTVLEEYGRNLVDYLLAPDRVQLARVLFGGLHRYPHLIEAERKAYVDTFGLLGRYLTRKAQEVGVELEDSNQIARNFTSQLIGIQLPMILGTGKLPSPQKRTKWVRIIVEVMLRGCGLIEFPRTSAAVREQADTTQ